MIRLYIPGASCEAGQLASLLELRGYWTSTEHELRDPHHDLNRGTRPGPIKFRNLQAAEALHCHAVVVHEALGADQVATWIAACRFMGVRCIHLDDLPAWSPQVSACTFYVDELDAVDLCQVEPQPLRVVLRDWAELALLEAIDAWRAWWRQLKRAEARANVYLRPYLTNANKVSRYEHQEQP